MQGVNGTHTNGSRKLPEIPFSGPLLSGSVRDVGLRKPCRQGAGRWWRTTQSSCGALWRPCRGGWSGRRGTGAPGPGEHDLTVDVGMDGAGFGGGPPCSRHGAGHSPAVPGRGRTRTRRSGSSATTPTAPEVSPPEAGAPRRRAPQTCRPGCGRGALGPRGAVQALGRVREPAVVGALRASPVCRVRSPSTARWRACPGDARRRVDEPPSAADALPCHSGATAVS